MKILFVTSQLEVIDGVSQYSRDMVRITQRRGHEVLCVTENISDLSGIEERAILLAPMRYLSNIVRIYLGARQLASISHEFRPDVIHFLIEPYALMLNFFSPNARSFVTIHGTYAFSPDILTGLKKIINYVLLKRTYNRINCIVSVSNYTAEHLVKKLSGDSVYEDLESKINIIKNGVDLSEVVQNTFKDSLRRKTKNILFVGSVKSRKGLLESLKVLLLYSKISPDFIYHVVGTYDENGSYYKKLVEFIKDNHLGKECYL